MSYPLPQDFSRFGVTGIEPAGVPGTPCVVLLSGGIDSLVTLDLVRRAEYQPHPLFIAYGQSNIIELEYAKAQMVERELQLRVVSIEGLGALSPHCSMLNGTTDAEKFVRISDVHVPARMAIFMSIAATYMFSLNTPFLAVGIQSEGLPQHHADASGTFVDQMEEALALALNCDSFQCFTPLLNMRKKQIAVLAEALNIPIDSTCSCLLRAEKMGMYPCGGCAACAPGGLPWR
ncbi:MAG: hypothetical protein E6R03_15630 [Hyphomicrobiaceae bacterium]|nr:MAG: hypothetical protein E6R03_15630 [Hyphomicrobiaceae bacterium]